MPTSMMCHDRADRLEGKPKRNWSEEQFLCASCTAKAQNKRPRRGRKPKETIAPDGEDIVMDDQAIAETNGEAMDISQATDVSLKHDSAGPPIGHTGVQSAPLLNDANPGFLTTQEQYSETLAEAQRVLASVALERPSQQPVGLNPPLPEQYSAELALAQRTVASGTLNNVPKATEQATNGTQVNGFSHGPDQWSSTGYRAAINGAPTSGT